MEGANLLKRLLAVSVTFAQFVRLGGILPAYELAASPPAYGMDEQSLAMSRRGGTMTVRVSTASPHVINAS